MNSTNSRKIAIGALLCITIVAATATALSFDKKTDDKWSELDAFKSKVRDNLAMSKVEQKGFNIALLAEELAGLRIDDMAVCASDEISADQYIQLASIADALSQNAQVTVQLNGLLKGKKGLSDCQFRVLDFATAKDSARAL